MRCNFSHFDSNVTIWIHFFVVTESLFERIAPSEIAELDTSLGPKQFTSAAIIKMQVRIWNTKTTSYWITNDSYFLSEFLLFSSVDRFYDTKPDIKHWRKPDSGSSRLFLPITKPLNTLQHSFQGLRTQFIDSHKRVLGLSGHILIDISNYPDFGDHLALAAPRFGRSPSFRFAAMDGMPRARANSLLAITVDVSGRGLNLRTMNSKKTFNNRTRIRWNISMLFFYLHLSLCQIYRRPKGRNIHHHPLRRITGVFTDLGRRNGLESLVK